MLIILQYPDILTARQIYLLIYIWNREEIIENKLTRAYLTLSVPPDLRGSSNFHLVIGTPVFTCDRQSIGCHVK